MGNLNGYAVVVPGLEGIAAEELNELSAHDIQMGDGGVAFVCSMDTLFRINLRSRTLTRVLIRLASFRALSFPELYNKCKKVAWQNYIDEHVSILVRASCSGSKLMHSGRAEQAMVDAVNDSLESHAVEATHEQQILLRIVNNQCTISLDVSGDRLDRRGYRVHSGKAPVRETIAASILRWMDWHADEPLLTPMCGSGTFAIEAAWLAQKRPSGLQHDFPFVHWPALKQKRWQRALDKATAMQHKDVMQGDNMSLHIYASDLDAAILQQAQANAVQAGVEKHIVFEVSDARSLPIPDAVKTSGLIVCNPPYGDRVKGDIEALYRQLGKHFKQYFSAWRIAVMVPDKACEKALGLTVKKRLKIKHGGKWMHVIHV